MNKPAHRTHLRRFRRTLAATMTLALVAQSGGAYAFECRTTQDAEAAHLRWLQTRMMVAALTCEGTAAYNEFVLRNKSTLDWSITHVNGMFARDHGASAGARYNQFNTQLANTASTERVKLDRLYCRSYQRVYDDAMSRNSAELVRYAIEPERVANGELPATCAQQALLAQKR